MEKMDYFPYMELPQLVQEMIADEIVQNSTFADQKQFILTSKYSNWLIQQSKMKKKISIRTSHFKDGKFICETSDDDCLNFSTEEEIVKFLKMIKFMEIPMTMIYDFFLISRFGYRSSLKDLWWDAMEFLERFHFWSRDEFFDINMEIASKLNHLKDCEISNSLPSEKLLKLVDAFPKLPNLTFFGQREDDEVLKLLASKSNKSSPLKKLELHPHIGFSIDAVEHLFKRATFVDSPQIFLKMNTTFSEIEEMFKRIDKFQVISLRQEGGRVVIYLMKIEKKIWFSVVMYL